jgi:hypothetical protein
MGALRGLAVLAMLLAPYTPPFPEGDQAWG